MTHLSFRQSEGVIDNFGDCDLLAEFGIEPTHDDCLSEASRSRDSLATASTEKSTVTVVARGVLELTLPDLCDLITERHSLQRAEIVSMEVYTEPAKVWGHRFMILELSRPQRKTLYLRLDRRRSRKAVALGLLRSRTVSAHDTVSRLLAVCYVVCLDKFLGLSVGIQGVASASM